MPSQSYRKAWTKTTVFGHYEGTMRVPSEMSTAFGAEFEKLISGFVTAQELLSSAEDLHSNRFLSRSVIPHVKRLSELFNREGKEQGDALDPYWKHSSNPAHLRLAYFIYFMPSNVFRVASVWAELARAGFRWKAGARFRGIEFGAGPASGACGVATGERFAALGAPAGGDWALIEQDKAMLELGSEWAQEYFRFRGFGDWGTRTFHRQLELKRGFLPASAPTFNAWVMSYFLNELEQSPAEIASALLDAWDRHLEDEGVVLLVEPALRLQSRKLLELRRAILQERERRGAGWLKLLLPCLGHQACGALSDAEDWCHEEVSWWRPPYFRTIDRLASLDRKTLPFSYLVFTKSKRGFEEILPGFGAHPVRQRLVSPSHAEGRDLEFFLCGTEGKRRARFRPEEGPEGSRELDRGDILLGADIRGDVHCSRVQQVKKIG